MFGHDENFDIPIVVDSPLACKMFKVYEDVLDEENKAKFLEVCNWKNVKFISNADESKLCVSDGRPKVILSSSGMLTAGRSVYYSKALLPDQNSTILFCGFASQNSLAYKIKNGDKQKTISIDKKAYANRCSIVDLKSFSSHIQREDMLMYYKQIRTDAIYLVHGDMDAKLEFAKDLKEELTKSCSTTKVCVVNKGTSITL
jgi:metallo-beta-lactamase family protein